MNRCSRKIVSSIIICCLMIALAPYASASSDTFRTTDGVNLRSSASNDNTANVIRTLSPGTNVEMIEHDPAGWSRVRVNGTVGYIRSDFLKFPIGNTPATFRTTDGVRFRRGPSIDSVTISVVNSDSSVDVLEHNPAGWSKVRINGTVGYIRSDFLTRSTRIVASAVSSTSSTSSTQTSTVLQTNARVNFRTAPSTTASIIRTLNSGTSVSVVEQQTNGWSKVSQNGTVGYIRSDLISPGGGGGGRVELLEWSAARNVIRNGVPMRVVDVRTGISFNIQSFSKGGHADVETITQADTDALLRTRNGAWSWSPRPVWVTIGDRTLAAALIGMPHAGSTIANNGMNGHICLHFAGTVTNNKSYQQSLREAVAEAWNAAQ